MESDLATLLQNRPHDVPIEQWDSIPEGYRLRWLKETQYHHALSAQQHAALRRLPFWMFYGPEHGAPEEWFNQQGYLLPKYRPGGGLEDDFKRWRHGYRRSTWRRRAIRARTERFFSRYGIVVYVLWVALCLGLATVLARLAEPYQEVLPYEGLRIAFIAVLAAVSLVLLRWLHRLAPDLFPWWRLDD